MSKTVVIIHTTSVTVNSLKDLTSEILKDYKIYNMLDDSMLPEIASSGGITEDVKYRFNNMIINATTLSPDAILCACSSIGGLTEGAKLLTDIPILRIDTPMARESVTRGKRIGVAATLISTLEPTEELIRKEAKEAGKDVEINTLVIDGTNSLIGEGKGETYDRIVSQNLLKLSESNDVVVLAQASMARALNRIPEKDRDKFLTSPRSGINSIKELLEE